MKENMGQGKTVPKFHKNVCAYICFTKNLRNNCSLHKVSFNSASTISLLMAAPLGDKTLSVEHHSEI